MERKTGAALMLLIVLVMSAFMSGEVKAGNKGGITPTMCVSRQYGSYYARNDWCGWHSGPYQGAMDFTCCPPPRCNDGYVPPPPPACSTSASNATSANGAAAASVNVPKDKASGRFPRAAKLAVSQPESRYRRISSALLTISILIGALGGIALSIKKLLRPAFVSLPRRRHRAQWALPFPRAVGFACVAAAFALISGAWRLNGSARLSIAKAKASPASLAADSWQVQPSATTAAAVAAAPEFSSALQIGSTGKTQIGGTAVDKQGNTYVAGAFFGNITFQTKPQATTLASTEDYDVFVAKFDASGQPLWARMANGATGLTHIDPASMAEEHFSLDGALSLAVDAQGNAYVGGGFVRSLSFKDASGKVVATLGDSNPDINFELFVAKFDASGTLAWARGGMSNALDNQPDEEDLASAINGITDIVVDKAGNPYVAGSFSGTNFLGRAVTNNGQRDVLLSRLNPATGAPVWVSTPGSAGIDAAKGLAIDDNANLYLIGDVGATITFPTQPQLTTLTVDDTYGDVFIAKYDQNGNALMAKQIAGDKPIEGIQIAASGAGELYLTGAFEGHAQFDSISLTDPSNGTGASGYLAKYDTNGNAVWARAFGHVGGENPNGDIYGYRVAVDGAGTPYVFGIFEGEATFGLESPAAQRTLKSEGESDRFIAHYDSAGNYQWAKQLAGSGVDDYSPSNPTDVPVEFVPLRFVYNNATNTMTVTGDLNGTLKLDRLTLNAGFDIQSYIATLPVSSAQFSAANYTVNENAGTVVINVTRTGDTSGAVSVNYATSDGTAQQRLDYLATTGTLSFAAGETSKTFTVSIIDDAYVEGNETINLTLSNPNPATTSIAAPVTVSLTILDNDTATPTTNPIDDTNFFVRQQYLDFLNREPDSGGFAYWTNLINGCGTDANCINSRRVSVSAAFFIEQEFQQTSFFVYRVRRASLGTQPTYAQFTADRNQIGLGSDANKTAFTQSFAQLPEFLAKYPASQTGSQFINALLANVKQSSGIDLSSKQNELANEYLMGSTQTESRARVIRKLVEYAEYTKAEYNPAFVLAEYFGYLRRDPDAGGYQFWLDVLNNRVPNNYRSMVCAFITSAEYQLRFSSVITRTDKVCGSLAP